MTRLTLRGPTRQAERKVDLEALTKEALLYLVVGAGVVGLAGLLAFSVDWHRVIRGQADFLQFYTGAELVGTDGLYSQSANREVHLRMAGFSMQGTYFVRLPFYAALLRPLAFLAYQPAYWVFQTLSIAAAIIFARLCRGPWQLTAAILLFFPLAVSVVGGQDVTLILVICAAAMMLHRAGLDASSGFVLSLCIIKFHLFALVPLVLLRHRKWRMIGGTAAGAVTWLIMSTLVAGPNWPKQYLSLLQSTAITPNPDRMPNIRGVFWGSPLWVYALVLGLAVFLYAVTKLRDFEAAFGLALAGGLILSSHSYLYDCALLLPALVSAVTRGGAAARGIALFLLTPIPYFLLLLGYGGMFLLSVLALAVMQTWSAPRPLGEPCAA